MFQGDLEMIIKIKKKSNKLYTSYSQGGALGLSRLSAVRSGDLGRLGFAFHLLINTQESRRYQIQYVY